MISSIYVLSIEDRLNNIFVNNISTFSRNYINVFIKYNREPKLHLYRIFNFLKIRGLLNLFYFTIILSIKKIVTMSEFDTFTVLFKINIFDSLIIIFHGPQNSGYKIKNKTKI
jgi:hypothetical protein